MCDFLKIYTFMLLYVMTKLNELLAPRGTKNQLAKYLGIERAMVSQWDKIGYIPSTTYLRRIAKYFKVKVDDLIP